MEAAFADMSTTKTGMVSVPLPTLRRLPGYHHYLVGLREAGRARVSCTAIAADLHLGSTQVRKDLEAAGIVGRPKVGYDLRELIASIEAFLGWNDYRRAFIAGVGDLGSALLGYPGFAQYGLDIIAGFDVDPGKVGTEIHGKPVLPIAKLAELPARMGINIGIIAVPAPAAQQVADLMTSGGITAIWNFASSLAVLLRKHAIATGRTASPEVEH